MKAEISIHAPREGSDAAPAASGSRSGRFLSTLPARGATPCSTSTSSPTPHFYPRSPRGERHTRRRALACPPNFYPRSPRGERRRRQGVRRRQDSYFYPRSPRGERHGCRHLSQRTGSISIHAPREGSDWGSRGEAAMHLQFLSTLPARGATSRLCRQPRRRQNFYPRSPRGERLQRAVVHLAVGGISIHAPREGSDGSNPPGTLSGRRFLSTLPARGATVQAAASDLLATLISIHAPREGSDYQDWTPSGEPERISIHAPREGSDTTYSLSGSLFFEISIHAPREGSDWYWSIEYCPSSNNISIHAPREGSDHDPPLPGAVPPDFYPRSPRGERPVASNTWM